MIKEIKLPEISESTEAGTVVSVLVSEGDTLQQDDPIIELETDKASVEVPATDGGTVSEVLVSDGDEVSVGQIILKVETADEDRPDGRQQAEDKEPAAQDSPVAEQDHPNGDKEAGEKREGDQKEAESEEEAATAEQPSSDEPSAPASSSDRASVPASPATRRFARELGVDIGRVRGSGPGGRILQEDVKAHVRDGAATGGGSPAPGIKSLPDFSRWGSTRRQAQNRIRSITAENTQYSWQRVPHVTQFDEADVSQVESFRQQYAHVAEAADTKLTVTAILVKVVAEALKRHPRFNASLDEESEEVVFKDFINVGVAVDSDRGLLVPVIHNADKRSVMDIAKRLSQLAADARSKKTKPEDLEGGTFTISNLGGIGGTAFTPVVFHPQVAILGVARANTVPVWRDGSFEPSLRLPLTLSYDHRVIDGADGARFLRWICKALEHPMFLHLEEISTDGAGNE